MKKLISALMAGAMMFGLVACGGGSTASPSPSASAPRAQRLRACGECLCRRCGQRS